jgi:hypothetical protein
MDNEEYIIAERKKKQTFLKAEILESGVDVGAFVAFLDSIREGGLQFI